MGHYTRIVPYLVGAAVLAAVLGVPLPTLVPFAIVLVCPLMMLVMMRGMTGKHDGEDHTGHGCEHDPTRGPAHHSARQPER